MRIITVLLGILAVVALTTGAAGAYLLSGELNLEREQRAAAETRAVAERLTRIDANNAATSERIGRVEAENAMGRQIRARMEAETGRIDALNLVASEKGARIEADNSAAQEKRARIEADNRAAQEKGARIEADNKAAQEKGARIEADNRAAQEKKSRGKSEERAEAESAKRVRAERARTAAEKDAELQKQARFQAESVARRETAKRVEAEAARKNGERELAKERSDRIALVQSMASQQILNELQKLVDLAGTHPMISAMVNGELSFYFEPLPYYAAPGVDGAVNDIEESLASWSPYGATLIQAHTKGKADVIVSWVRDYGSHTIGESIYRTHINVGLGTNNCLGEWTAFDAATVKKILWHELGHSMGYGHSQSRINVMYPSTDTRFHVDSDFSEVIAGGWYYTIPICGEGRFSYTFEAKDPSASFDIAVLPPNVDPHEFSGGRGRAYIGCGSDNSRRYFNSCNVADGSIIYISNRSFTEAIRLTGQVISVNIPPWPDMDWDDEAFRYDPGQLKRYQFLITNYRNLLPR